MSASGRTPQELRTEIGKTRRELGGTVEQLAAKTAIRKQLQDRIEQAKADLRHHRETHPVEVVAVAGGAILLFISWTLSLRSG